MTVGQGDGGQKKQLKKKKLKRSRKGKEEKYTVETNLIFSLMTSFLFALNKL